MRKFTQRPGIALALVVILLLMTHSYAETTFSPPVTVFERTVRSPDMVLTCDVDRDSFPDMIVGTYYDKIYAFPNPDGEFEFANAILLGEFSSLKHFTLADVNGDGFEDLIVLANHSLYTALNTGTYAGFMDLQYICGHQSHEDLAVVDIDGDGDNDIILPQHFNEIDILLNSDGLGNYTFDYTFLTRENDLEVHAADLDGDSHVDLIAISNNTFYWYPNMDGTGMFHDSTCASFPTPIGQFMGYVRPNFVDLDQDGDIDVLAYHRYMDDIILYANDGSGDLSQLDTLILDVESPDQILPIDIDNDGDLDIAFSEGRGHGVSLSINTGVSPTPFSQPIAVEEIAEYVESFALADFDQDGDKDLAAGIRFGDKVSWFQNDQSEDYFGAEIQLSFSATGINALALGDIDADGYEDLLVSSYLDDQLTWLEQIDESPYFEFRQEVTSTLDEARSAKLADIDQDGDLDVVAAGYRDSTIVYYLYDSDEAKFGDQVLIADSLFHPYAIEVADIDSDGDPDLIVIDDDDEYILRFINHLDTGQLWEPIAVENGPDGHNSIECGDVNGDGNVDLLVGGGNPRLSWLNNSDGQGSFSEFNSLYDQGGWVRFPQLVDLDGDLDLDIVTDANTSRVIWYENLDGAGNFSSYNIIISNLNDWIDWIGVEDIDNDGDKDLFIIWDDNEVLAWYENLDSAGFSGQNVISDNLDNATVAAFIDADGDGDLDILLADWVEDYTPRLSLFLVETTVAVDDELLNQPESYLSVPYPNPTNGETHFKLALHEDSNVQIDIINLLGQSIREIKHASLGAGEYQFTWNGLNDSQLEMSSGVYFIRVQTPNTSMVQRLLLIK